MHGKWMWWDILGEVTLEAECPSGSTWSGGVPIGANHAWCAKPDGTKHGKSIKWFEIRKLSEEGEYHSGKAVKLACWNKDGKAVKPIPDEEEGLKCAE